jgi:hypothetical protein
MIKSIHEFFPFSHKRSLTLRPTLYLFIDLRNLQNCVNVSHDLSKLIDSNEMENLPIHQNVMRFCV